MRLLIALLVVYRLYNFILLRVIASYATILYTNEFTDFAKESPLWDRYNTL